MWEEKDNHLTKEYVFPDFALALEFVNKVGQKAEAANHHPDITLSWGRVVVSLTTHSEGGITLKDHELAAEIDAIASKG